MNAVRATLLTFVAGLLLAGLVWIAMSAPVPRLWSPMPILLVVLYWTLQEMPLVCVMPPLVFWVWSAPLFLGSRVVPARTLVLAILVALASLVWTATTFTFSLGYHGPIFTVGCAFINIVVILLLIVAVRHNRKSPSFASALLIHWALFAWLFSFAFAYTAEMP